MKLSFLLIGLSLAFCAHAQESALPNKLVAVESPPSIENALRGMANPHYVVLKHVTPVYYQAADTVNGRFALKLPPGTKIYIRDWVPGGLLIDFGLVGERYYLPEKSVKGLQTMVEI
ncbi:hypothetical protein Q5H92_00495 [Hymenobacter sp. M29]|uniref:Uncharacterized protein n=1 Tax=Hymenobacter mellowenesis TaxID=3063995 RepID=A0ABT9A5M2_9BACT|nr:hypothetical protein [Hymenobacter sp. M29]MDO7844818.1 hypothetical protein [Hymenobacter sp. M29]